MFQLSGFYYTFLGFRFQGFRTVEDSSYNLDPQCPTCKLSGLL